MDDLSVSKVINIVSKCLPRNFIVAEVKNNLLAEERTSTLARFPSSCYKKVVQVMLGEPPKDFKGFVQEAMLKEKQALADAQARRKKAEAARKKAQAEKQKKLEEGKKKLEEERKKRQEAKKAEQEAKKAEDEAKKAAEGAEGEKSESKPDTAKEEGDEKMEAKEEEEEKVEAKEEEEKVEEKAEEKAAEEEEEEEEEVKVELTEEEKKTLVQEKRNSRFVIQGHVCVLRKFFAPNQGRRLRYCDLGVEQRTEEQGIFTKVAGRQEDDTAGGRFATFGVVQNEIQ